MAEELAHLDRVAALLEEVPYEIPPSEAEIVNELLRLRDEMPGAKAEDRGSLMAQYNQLVHTLEQLRSARQRPQVDPGCPYFAHMKLRENGRERDLFLGKATRIQRGVRIVDWRNAPISQIFYRYQQGEEYEEDVGDLTLAGQVVARRTVAIANGDLQRVEAPEGVFSQDPLEPTRWVLEAREKRRLAGGEGSAVRAHQLGEGSHRRLGTSVAGARRRLDKRLPDIAGLIDEDQFALITRPTSGFVVIRGTAGSGKTTVALHRIAWMAFADPKIDSPATLFLVFSHALRDYVSHVLPALGVEQVQVRSFRDWAREQRRQHFPKLPKTIRDDTPADVVRLKLHPAMLRVLQRQVADITAPASPAQAVDDWASSLMNVDLLQSVLDEMDPGVFSRAQLERITTWCRDRHDELIAWQEGDRDVRPELDVEDDALLLRAWQLRVGKLKSKRGKSTLTYRHVAIDEVQDFSPLEVRVLLDCLDKNQSITLAGDTQQHVIQQSGFTSWSDFFRHLGVEGTEVSTLRISYRCSLHVASFAMAVLGDLREDDTPPLTTRTGPEVELFRFTDHGACVAFLSDALNQLVRDEPVASIAVLTPGADLSALYYEGLYRGEVPRLRRVTEEDFTFAPGVEVTEVEQVKGLEFDYVILVEASARRYPDSPAARRLLHVGATRAVHQLWMTTVGTPSPLVREALLANEPPTTPNK